MFKSYENVLINAYTSTRTKREHVEYNGLSGGDYTASQHLR